MNITRLPPPVSGPIPAFGTGPGDVPEWILDITGLAVKAVGGVQLQLFPECFFIHPDFINIPRTEPGTGTLIRFITSRNANLRIMNHEMRGLILPVQGFGQIDTG